MPSCIVEHAQDDARQARFGFPRKGFEQSLKKFLAEFPAELRLRSLTAHHEPQESVHAI
jgi:hypothetical protein